MEETAEETAKEKPSQIDVSILGWAINALTHSDDDPLESSFGPFLAFSSRISKKLSLIHTSKRSGMVESFFFDRTSPSNFLNLGRSLKDATTDSDGIL